MKALIQAFVSFADPGQRRRLITDEMFKATAAADARREDHGHKRQMVLIDGAAAVAVALIFNVTAVVYLVRDQVDLVRAVFEGVGLLVSHGAVGIGGYAIGRSRKPAGRQ